MILAKSAMDQSFQAMVRQGGIIQTKGENNGKEKKLKKLRALRMKLAPKIKPKKTPEERAVIREQLQKYVYVKTFLFCFPLRFGTIFIGLLDMIASAAVCAAYVYMAIGMFDGSTMDTFEEIGFHIRTCNKNESLASFTSGRLERTYLMLSIQRYVMITFVVIIICMFGVSAIVSFLMHEGTKSNDKLCLRAWIYTTFMRVPFCVPTGLALVLGCQGIANAFTHEVVKMQQEFLRVSGKEYIFDADKTLDLRNELLINGSGLLGYGLINVYFLLVVAAFYINMDEIIFKKMTRLTKRPMNNPFVEEGYTPATVVTKAPKEPRSVKKDATESKEELQDQSDGVHVKSKEDFLDEAAKNMAKGDGQTAGDNLSVLSLTYSTRPPARTKEDLEIPDDPELRTDESNAVVHSIFTEERFMDADGGGKMTVYAPVGRHGENRDGMHLRRRHGPGHRAIFGRKKVAFAEDAVVVSQPMTMAWTGERRDDIDGVHQRAGRNLSFADHQQEGANEKDFYKI